MSRFPILPDGFFKGMDRAAVKRAREGLRGGDLRVTRVRNDYQIRSSSPSEGYLVRLWPLQIKNGQLRADAAKILPRDPVLSPDVARRLSETRRQELTSVLDQRGVTIHTIQYALWVSANPLDVLRKFLEKTPELRLYRVTTTLAYSMREYFWNALASLAEGDVSFLRFARNREIRTPVLDVLQAFGGDISPALLAVPLAARLQPLSTTVTTDRNAHVLITSTAAFGRPPHEPSWPVTGLLPGVSGPVEDLYQTRYETIPHGIAGDLTQQFSVAANNLLGYLTAPETWWSEAKGVIEWEKRMVAWSTIMLGIGAIGQIAEEWGSAESIWSGFRALGILQGLWEGQEHQPGLLRALFHPDVMRKYAVPALPKGFLQNWYDDIVGNFESELLKFSPSVSESVEDIVQIRNLVHGTHSGGQAGGRRLRALRLAQDSGLELVKDVATLWWTAVLFKPREFCVLGSSPISAEDLRLIAPQ